MSYRDYVGRTVTLTDCSAWRAGEELEISGSWFIEDYEPYDPAAYVNTEQFVLYPAESPSEPDVILEPVYVEAWALCENIGELDPYYSSLDDDSVSECMGDMSYIDARMTERVQWRTSDELSGYMGDESVSFLNVVGKEVYGRIVGSIGDPANTPIDAALNIVLG